MNIGPNWKCGQEASIRILNLIIANEVLGAGKETDDYINLLKIHIDRIVTTTFYAKAQDNNHGISEGIALYLGAKLIADHTKLKKYNIIHKKGLKLIENRIEKLILDDGTFSQYSIFYHRMVLDMISFVELTRKKWSLESFTDCFYERITKATIWYESLIDPVSGGAPNMGGNDGTYLFNFDDMPSQDFRPTLSLVSSAFSIPINPIFNKKHIMQSIFRVEQLYRRNTSLNSKAFLKGGILKLNRPNGMSVLRCPKYIFRPSNSDALHVDIWQDGINWVRDAGSYSYAIKFRDLDDFSGTKGHSTIQFDNKNQMPRISRFLFSDWLKPHFMDYDNDNNIIRSAYTDHRKNYHCRTISRIDKGWRIDDIVSGHFSIGILRFLLCPGEWVQTKNKFQNGNTIIEINSKNKASYMMSIGYESLFYMEKSKIPVVEVSFKKENSISTKIIFKN